MNKKALVVIDIQNDIMISTILHIESRSALTILC